jgi:hypothetical protein
VTNALERVRAICRPLPEVIETTTFGHPTFQAGKKRTFAVIDDAERAGLLCLVVKLGLDEQEALVDDARFFRCKSARSTDGRRSRSTARRTGSSRPS